MKILAALTLLASTLVATAPAQADPAADACAASEGRFPSIGK